ncbi:Fic family protein [Enterococcus timonensis]|uniref:Fic family protein n=1 Tax=Enterococcus timonensis TaxID=1852364 RepID=UPI0008D91D65|nr:Fic family protein [Enterococcus timonensis]
MEQFPDKFNLTRDLNVRYARSNFAELIYTTSRFEGVNTTLPQTQTILAGMGVDGVPLEDINTIVYLKRAWDYITKETSSLTIEISKKINAIVAKDDALYPGQLRKGSGGVSLMDGTSYTPPLEISQEAETEYLNTLMDSPNSITDKAMTMMYHIMRTQIFWDGNKRTATLAANKIMMDGGAGLIHVPLEKWHEWNQLISEYYVNGDMSAIKKWTYENGIVGPTIL